MIRSSKQQTHTVYLESSSGRQTVSLLLRGGVPIACEIVNGSDVSSPTGRVLAEERLPAAWKRAKFKPCDSGEFYDFIRLALRSTILA